MRLAENAHNSISQREIEGRNHDSKGECRVNLASPAFGDFLPCGRERTFENTMACLNFETVKSG